MFDAIRNNQKILQFILLVLILPAFAFFGVSSYTRNDTKQDVVAEVGDQKITRQEFDRALTNQLQQMRQMLGDQVDISLINSPEVRKSVLESLTLQKTLLADAQKQGLSGSMAQVEAAIRSNRNLVKPDGSIDVQTLKEVLGRQGMSLESFQQQMQRDMGAQLKPDAIGSTAFMPNTVAEYLLKLAEEVREVRELKFAAKDFEAKVTPTADQLKAFYDANQKQFQIPESAKIEYVIFSPEAMASQVSLNADDVKTYYEQNKDKYRVKEERQASHILIKLDGGKDVAKAKAQGLLDQVKKDPSKFAELAKTHSQDPGSGAQGGDLGFFARESMVKPFADAAFAMKQGDVSDLVESEFGFHIIRLTAIKAEAARPFDEVKPELELELKKQQSQKKFTEGSQQFMDLVYEQADSFKPVVDKLKVATQVIEMLPRTGLPKPVGAAPPAPGSAAAVFSNPQVLAALFADESVKRKRNIAAIELPPNVLVSARVLEHTAAKTKAQEAVAAELVAGVKREQGLKLAKEAGQARQKLALSDASGYGAPITVSRSTQTNLAQPAMEAIFRSPRTTLPNVVGVELPGEGYVLYQILSIKEGQGDEVAKRKEQALAQVSRSGAGLELYGFVNSLKARIPVTVKADPTEQAVDKDKSAAAAKTDTKDAAKK